MTIDILIPTRGRPDRLHDMMMSAIDTANSLDLLRLYWYLDEDDVTNDCKYSEDNGLIYTHVGKQKTLSQCWNDLYKLGTGEILMHCSDDIIFETQGWDTIVRDYFADKPVGLLYGQDGHQDENCATHSFTTRKAADIIGYFVPPYFEADWNDVWLHKVYKGLAERTGKPYLKYDPRIMTRHLHKNVDAKYDDETYRLAEERRQRASAVWHEKNHLIENDIQKLMEAL